ncbi:MAG: ABC transporter ATP-binding protein [bacterium]
MDTTIRENNLALSISDLSYRYADGTLALQDVNFQLASGESLAVIGPNGAGKSTLLLCIAGIFMSSGNVFIQNQRLTEKNRRALRRKLALVFQDPDDQLFMPTLAEDVAFGPRNLGLAEAEVQERVEWTLALLGLTNQANRPPHHLSFGEKRRAAIAIALAMKADLLLLDEPTANLDPATRYEVIEFLSQLPSTKIIATHDLELARQLGTRCLLLASGKQIALDSNGEILNNVEYLVKYRLAPQIG